MITHIRVKNFKSWQDSDIVKLASLTGFFGTNSSGKSSLLQMLLLLKQTAEGLETRSSEKEEVIFFGNENSLVNLGNFREVIHGHKQDELLELEFGCKFGKPHLIDLSVEGQQPWIADMDRFAFNTVVGVENGELIVQNLEYTDYAGTWKIMWSKDTSYRMGNEDGTQFINGTSLGYAASRNCYGTPSSNYYAEWEQKFLKQTSLIFEDLFSHVHYLGPTRVHPQRHYHWERTHPKEIDVWGNKAVDALLSARVTQLTTAHNGKRIPIEERISKWFQKMELAHSFRLIPIGDLDDNNYEIRIQKTPNSAEVTLADMGYGVGDLFPLLVHCCYVPEGSTLILEQPGVHLHPKAQADLADLLIEVITERNLQILIESHSEHLLNRLQRRIAEEKISAAQTELYFCRNDEGVSRKDRLIIDEFGNIENWPENFFGDEMGDLFAMTEAQRERQKGVPELIEGITVAPSKG